MVLSNGKKYTYKEVYLKYSKLNYPVTKKTISFTSIKPLEVGKKIVFKEWGVRERTNIVRTDLNIFVY